MVRSERQIINRVAVSFGVLYIALVVSFAALKAGTAHFGSAPWSEVVYGPAITTVFTFLLFYAGVRLESWIRGSD